MDCILIARRLYCSSTEIEYLVLVQFLGLHQVGQIHIGIHNKKNNFLGGVHPDSDLTASIQASKKGLESILKVRNEGLLLEGCKLETPAGTILAGVSEQHPPFLGELLFRGP